MSYNCHLVLFGDPHSVFFTSQIETSFLRFQITFFLRFQWQRFFYVSTISFTFPRFCYVSNPGYINVLFTFATYSRNPKKPSQRLFYVCKSTTTFCLRFHLTFLLRFHAKLAAGLTTLKKPSQRCQTVLSIYI